MTAPTSAAPEPAPDQPDIHTTAGKLADFRRHIDEVAEAGHSRGAQKQHDLGKMTARERIAALVAGPAGMGRAA